MVAKVSAVGTSLLKPSVYLRPMAQPISKSPATTRMIHAIAAMPHRRWGAQPGRDRRGARRFARPPGKAAPGRDWDGGIGRARHLEIVAEPGYKPRSLRRAEPPHLGKPHAPNVRAAGCDRLGRGRGP